MSILKSSLIDVRRADGRDEPLLDVCFMRVSHGQVGWRASCKPSLPTFLDCRFDCC